MLKKLSVKLTILFATLIIIGFVGYFFLIGTPKDRAHRLFIDATGKLINIGNISAFIIPEELMYRLDMGLKPVAPTKSNYNTFFSGITSDLLCSIKLDQSNRRAYYFLGTAYYSWGVFCKRYSNDKYIDYFKLSIKYFKLAIKHRQYISMALEQSFAIYLYMKKYGNAIDVAEKLALRGKIDTYYYFIITAHICQGTLVEAEKIAERAIESNNKLFVVHQLIAAIYFKSGRIEEALRKIDYLVKTNPKRKKEYIAFRKSLLEGQLTMCEQ